MLAKVKSGAIDGLEAKLIEIEIDISRGLPAIKIVGLPDKAVEEARERVQAAIKNSDASFPNRKLTVNLAPADLKKEGPAFDLPMAIGVLAAAKQVKLDKDGLYLGELSLDGKLRRIRGALPYALLAKEKGIKRIYLPEENCSEIAFLEGIEIKPVYSLDQLLCFLKDEINIPSFKIKPIKHYSVEEIGEEYDISNVKGQEQAKRALMISAAGGHNVLFSGPPGTGKTILAKSLITILPKLTTDQTLETSKVYSVVNKLSEDRPLMSQPPFRAPHHSASSVSIVGGGQNPKPGEISLAHHGILFLDEVAEFHRDVLESLRQPLESKVVTVARAKDSVEFPADFILIAAQNPCPCGFLTHPKKECVCTMNQINNYNKKISGPILDRFDIFIEVPPISYSKLTSKKRTADSSSYQWRVEKTRQTQRDRFKSDKLNSQMSNREIKEHCVLDEDCQGMMKEAVDSFSLSARAYFMILRLARTIADLNEDSLVKSDHIAEALQYRQQDNFLK